MDKLYDRVKNSSLGGLPLEMQYNRRGFFVPSLAASIRQRGLLFYE